MQLCTAVDEDLVWSDRSALPSVVHALPIRARQLFVYGRVACSCCSPSHRATDLSREVVLFGTAVSYGCSVCGALIGVEGNLRLCTPQYLDLAHTCRSSSGSDVRVQVTSILGVSDNALDTQKGPYHQQQQTQQPHNPNAAALAGIVTIHLSLCMLPR